jgi:hypothetical protein
MTLRESRGQLLTMLNLRLRKAGTGYWGRVGGDPGGTKMREELVFLIQYFVS